MGYATFPFVLLEFDVSLRLYLKYFMCLHLVALATIFILPKLIGGEKRSLSSSKSSNIQTNHSSNGTLKTNKDLSSTGSTHHNNNNNNNNVNSKCNTKDLINNQKPINYADELEIDDDNFKDCSSNSCNNKLDKVNSCDKNCKGHECCNDDNDQYHQEEQSNNKSLINDTNYLLKDLINNKIKDSDNLSNLIKEKIENCKIEGLIDKTVNGIVELKDDLMRINNYPNNTTTSTNENLRKRINVNGGGDGGDGTMNVSEPNGTFLKKEIDAINAAVQQANVLPAVLSNGHGK
jgi:hypothetical protein